MIKIKLYLRKAEFTKGSLEKLETKDRTVVVIIILITISTFNLRLGFRFGLSFSFSGGSGSSSFTFLAFQSVLANAGQMVITSETFVLIELSITVTVIGIFVGVSVGMAIFIGSRLLVRVVAVPAISIRNCLRVVLVAVVDTRKAEKCTGKYRMKETLS